MDKKKIMLEIGERRDLVDNRKVVAVYLFGSVVNGKNGPLSDVDVCVIGNGFTWEERFKIMGEFSDGYDVSFFDDMPIWIKMRVLKGVPVIVRDRDMLYDISFSALAEYEDFKPLLRERILRRFGKCTI